MNNTKQLTIVTPAYKRALMARNLDVNTALPTWMLVLGLCLELVTRANMDVGTWVMSGTSNPCQHGWLGAATYTDGLMPWSHGWLRAA